MVVRSLVDLHAGGAAEHALARIGQRQAAIRRDNFAAGEDGQILELSLASIAQSLSLIHI